MRYLRYEYPAATFSVRMVILGLKLLILGIVLSSCSARSNTHGASDGNPPGWLEQSIIGGEPCMVPCWYGLEPGQSKESEAKDRIHELGFVLESSVKETVDTYLGRDGIRREGVMYSARCIAQSTDPCIGLLVFEGKLHGIQIRTDDGLPLAQLISSLGTPDGVAPIPSGVEEPACIIDVIWIQHRVRAAHSIPYDGAWPELCQLVSEGSQVPIEIEMTRISIETEEWFENNYPRSPLDLPWPGIQGDD